VILVLNSKERAPQLIEDLAAEIEATSARVRRKSVTARLHDDKGDATPKEWRRSWQRAANWRHRPPTCVGCVYAGLLHLDTLAIPPILMMRLRVADRGRINMAVTVLVARSDYNEHERIDPRVSDVSQ